MQMFLLRSIRLQWANKILVSSAKIIGAEVLFIIFKLSYSINQTSVWMVKCWIFLYQHIKYFSKDISIWQWCLFLVLIECTDKFIWNFSWLFSLFIYINGNMARYVTKMWLYPHCQCTFENHLQWKICHTLPFHSAQYGTNRRRSLLVE